MMTKSVRMDRNILGLRGWVAAQTSQLTAISEAYTYPQSSQKSSQFVVL